MFTEIAHQAEIDYRRQRFLDEAHWYSLGQLAQANAPARKSWLASVLTGRPSRRARQVRSQRIPSQREAATDRSSPCTV